MKHYSLRLLMSVAASLLVGLIAGWLVNEASQQWAVQRIVAMSWGDGKYGPAFYGAEVFLAPVHDEYSVQARVWIGRGNGYCHDLGELGRVSSAEEATARWGQIAWNAEGLVIGPGDPQPFLFPSAKLESHR